MSIFDRKRIGTSVFCKASRAGQSLGYSTVLHGYVRWTHAMVGQTVKSLEVIGFGHVPGPWTVEEVDVSR